MSLLSQQTNANTTETYFVRMNGKVLNVSTVNANTISTNALSADSISTTLLSAYEGTFSTFSTAQIDIDGQLLTATPTELLLNGIPVATASSLSSIADWAIDPAISTVQMAGNNLLGASTISCITLVADQGIVAGNLQAGNGLFQNLVAFNSLFVSSNTSTISSLAEFADLGVFSTISTGYLEAATASLSTLVCQSISTPALEVSSINGAEFTSTTIKVDLGSFSSLVANSVSSVGAQIREALISTIVFSPSLNPSLGGVNVNLGLGGILGNVIGWGAGVLGAATGIVALGTSAFALASGRQTNYIDNSRYEIVNGATQLQFSTLGVPFSTIYRLTDSADPERTPGAEVFISTVNPPGVAVRSVSDPINTLSSPSSTIQAFGQWVPVPDELVNVSSFQEASISSLTVSSINNAAYPPAIPGNEDWANYPAVSTINFSTGVAAVIAASAGGNIALSGTDIQLIGGFTDAKNLLIVSSISTAKVLGADPNLFGLGIQGLTIQTAAGGQVFISTSQTNIQGLINASSLGAFNVAARNGGFSTVQASSLSFASGILSSILSVSSAGASGNTSTLLVSNTDFSVGAGDIFAGQIRLNAGAGQVSGEIIITGGDGAVQAIDRNTADRTFRTRQGANTALSTGYFLDTYSNPPFFSTINMSSAMMAYFPSTISNTIGVSTISFIPPKVVAGAFTSLSTQVVPAANSSFTLAYTTTDLAVGGISFSTTAVVIPSPGVYEITHSIQLDKNGGGISECDFWYRKNGVDVPNSASQIVVDGTNGEVLANISLILSLATNDKLEVAIASPDATMAATFFQSTVTTPYTRPAIPSLITNVKCLNY